MVTTSFVLFVTLLVTIVIVNLLAAFLPFICRKTATFLENILSLKAKMSNYRKVTELPKVNLGQQKSKRKSPGKGFSFASTSCIFKLLC